jgi:hypothetical protein
MAFVWTFENHTRDCPFHPDNDRLRTGDLIGMEDRTHGCDHGYGGRPLLQLLEAQTKNSAKQPRDWARSNSGESVSGAGLPVNTGLDRTRYHFRGSFFRWRNGAFPFALQMACSPILD